MKKRECTREKSNEIFPNAKPKSSAVYVLQMTQGDFTLMSMHKFQKHQYILHHTCTTKKSCENFFDDNDNTIKSNLQSQLSSFVKFSKTPNCFLVKKYVKNELHLGMYALRDIRENEELSISEKIDNSLEICNDFNSSFPKELNPLGIKFLRAMYLKRLVERLNDGDLDIFELKTLEISSEERNHLNNLPNLVSMTQSLEYSILSHFSSSNLSSPKFLYSLTSKNNINKITLASLTQATLKLFNLPESSYNQVYSIISLEHSTIALTQKLSMLLNTYRLFLLWINCEHTFTYVSRLERFFICYVISFNSLMENWISINDWAKLLLSVGVLIDSKDEGKGNEMCEESIERFKWLQLKCLECVEFKCMITICAHYNFLKQVCDKFDIIN